MSEDPKQWEWREPYRSPAEATEFIASLSVKNYAEASMVADGLQRYAMHLAQKYSENHHNVKLAQIQEAEALAERYRKIAHAHSSPSPIPFNKKYSFKIWANLPAAERDAVRKFHGVR